MDYELAKKLKDAGFPQTGKGSIELGYPEPKVNSYTKTTPIIKEPLDEVYHPTLEELIEACGDKFHHLVHEKNTVSLDEWCASDGSFVWKVDACWGMTPSGAVAKLWLALNAKKEQ
jgi:hypothetical protein